MRSMLRLAACAALVAGLVAAAELLFPAWLRDLGLDPAEWWAWQRRIDDQYERERELNRRWAVSAGRDRVKTQICQELIAGRISLREAARRFEELPDPPARLREDLRINFPVGTDAERLSRHVIAWACDLPERADEVTALRRRLEEELRTGT